MNRHKMKDMEEKGNLVLSACWLCIYLLHLWPLFRLHLKCQDCSTVEYMIWIAIQRFDPSSSMTTF
jgi:hypothetical protein